MKKGMNQEILRGKAGLKTAQIDETLLGLNGKVKFIVQTLGQNNIRHFLKRRLLGFYTAACRLLRYLKGNTQMTTVHDLVNAGPRHRYALPGMIVSNCTLGAGYGVGPTKFKKVAKTMAGLDLSDEAAAEAVYQYRRTNPKTVAFWHEHHEALAYSARRRDDTHEVELKSGRVLTYWEPRIVGREIEVYQTRGEHKTRVYGGKLVENEVQASCRDILCDAWLACASEGYYPVLNVHDELVFEIDKGTEEKATSDITRLMTTCSPWAEGLPLGVDVVISDVYTK